MMKNYSLYIHTNKINGKKYIGITNQQPVSRRWSNGMGYKKSPRFFNAIIKYGWDNFHHQIIYENLTKDNAETLEKQYIKKYNTTNEKYGYNIQKGGGITNLSELTKYKIKMANKGRKHTLETRKKMSISHIGKQKCLGYKHSEETKEKHRQYMIGKKNHHSRAVNQYDLEENFIKTFECMQDAVNELGLKSSSHISMCCSGKRNKFHGYIWKYSNMEGGKINGKF